MADNKIIFASDLAPIRGFAGLMAENPPAVYGDAAEYLQSGAYNIVNLESPLCNMGSFIAKSGAAFTGELNHIDSLKAGFFKAAVLANNHTFDSHLAGFLATRDLLKKNHITPVGAGENIEEARQHLAFEVNNTRCALFTISEGEDMMGAAEGKYGVRPWEPEFLAEEIRAMRSRFDVIIISAHCGLEYQPYPSIYVYDAFKLWAEAGADVIIGHHPHVPQGMTFFGKTAAYFSLGNFVFYQPNNLYYRKIGYMVEMEVADGRLLSHQPVPYRITDGGIELLKNGMYEEFFELFAKLSAPLQSRSEAEKAWHAVLAHKNSAGFIAELRRIADTMESDPVKGAAMLRNRVNCMQHATEWTDGTTRIMAEKISDADPEYLAMVKDFMLREKTW